MDVNLLNEIYKFVIIFLGFVEMFEGFVFVVLCDKLKDLVDYVVRYFFLVKIRMNFLREYGVSVDDLGVDFFIVFEWNGLVWMEDKEKE